MRAAATLLALALFAPVRAEPAEDEIPGVLKVNPFRKGFEGWERPGSEKAFAWNEADATLTVKGQAGKEPSRAMYTRISWNGGGLRFQAKKGAKKVRVAVQPAGGKPVGLEFPRDAVKATPWTELGVVLRGGKAVLLAPGADGKEAEVGAAEVPAGAACRFGFEAPAGTDAVLTGIRLEREYENDPPFAEEGFESTFDGQSLGAWQPFRPEFAPMFTVENGLLVGMPRAEGGGGIALASRTYRAYELRLRAYWGTNHLEVRAVEFPGGDGMVNRFDTMQVNLGDNVDPENLNDVVVRVADGTCAMTVNGKKVFESKVKPFEATPIAIFLQRGKRFLLRDIRIKDLAAEQGK